MVLVRFCLQKTVNDRIVSAHCKGSGSESMLMPLPKNMGDCLVRRWLCNTKHAVCRITWQHEIQPLSVLIVDITHHRPPIADSQLGSQSSITCTLLKDEIPHHTYRFPSTFVQVILTQKALVSNGRPSGSTNQINSIINCLFSPKALWETNPLAFFRTHGEITYNNLVINQDSRTTS